MKPRFFLVAAMAFFLSANAQQSNPLLKNEARITEIIKSMTLEEKVNMLHGKNMFSSAGVERLGIPDLEYADGLVCHVGTPCCSKSRTSTIRRTCVAM